MSPEKDTEQWNCSSADISSTSPLGSYWKANEKQGLPQPYLTALVQNLADVRIAVTRLGSPKPSASLTNWIKLRWWKTSCVPPPPPLRHHTTLSLAGISGSLSPRRALRVADVKLTEAEQRWVHRLEQGGGTSRASARREEQYLLPPNDTYMTVISQFMPRGNELWFKPLEVFLWDSQLFFILFYPRFQVQLQTQKCVSPLSAEMGFMCST